MGERYWITGVQLGLLRYALTENMTKEKAIEITEDIEENQFIDNMPEPHEDYKIVMVKK